MKNTVILKGNKYGITIVLDKDVDFSVLLSDLSNKLESAEDFFDSDKQLAISFEGRELSNEEMDEVLYVIQNNSKLNIQYVMEQNNELEVTFFDIIQTAKEMDHSLSDETSFNDNIMKEKTSDDVSSDEGSLNTDASNENVLNEIKNVDTLSQNNPNENGLFYKGTLRSGQSLETQDSIIIIGDVNPGATVLAGGNIIVIGSLKGSVIAGKTGNQNAFVMALSMNPISIQIADIKMKPTGIKKIPKSKKEDAMIAMIMDNQIHIEMVSKAAIHNIE